MEILQGECKSASLCRPVESVKIFSSGQLLTETDPQGLWRVYDEEIKHKIRFEKDGYVAKEYRVEELPREKEIRLLEDKIIGYSNQLSYFPGETAFFYIHSSREFQAELVRYGQNVEIIEEFGQQPDCVQQVPDGKFVEQGLDWKISMKVQLTKDMRPGLWALRVYDGQDNYGITFVLSTPKKRTGKDSNVVVLASDTTWRSYNVWGGRSRYRNFEDGVSLNYILLSKVKSAIKGLTRNILPDRAVQLSKRLRKRVGLGIPEVITVADSPEDWRFRKLSIHRPFPNCSIIEDDVNHPFTSHLAAGEWRVLAWLEREDIPYDIIDGYDLHCNQNLLSDYNALILNTHCEYWSKEMYTAFKRYLSNGGWILNLSGNSIYREIEFFEDRSHHCVSLKFQNPVEDELALLGVRFDERGYGTCAPFKVENPDHWIFIGTNLTQGDIFAENSLNCYTKDDEEWYDSSHPGMETKGALAGKGGSGWETDKLTPNAPDDIVLLAKGQNSRGGGADMIIREPNDSSGGIFSASSITFGGSLLVDPVSSRIVKNVLGRALGRG